MNRIIIFLSIILSFCYTNTFAGNGVLQNNDKKTNILFVFIDDMGFADLGCYGREDVHTPNIDRLASEGILFTQFYVNSPICSPSRTAVTTGQYPARWGITSYIDSRKANENRGMKNYLDLSAPSVARNIQAAGYYTAHIGKWHMGGGRDVGEAPLITEYGFDESVTQFEGLGERFLATYETLNLPDSTRGLEKQSAGWEGEKYTGQNAKILLKFLSIELLTPLKMHKKRTSLFTLTFGPMIYILRLNRQKNYVAIFQ